MRSDRDLWKAGWIALMYGASANTRMGIVDRLRGGLTPGGRIAYNSLTDTHPENDMTDLIERLRFANATGRDGLAICGEAADEITRLQAQRDELLAACQTFHEWLRREEEGFVKAGNERDTPEGEAAWRAWYDENLRICDLAQKQARAAIENATKDHY